MLTVRIFPFIGSGISSFLLAVCFFQRSKSFPFPLLSASLLTPPLINLTETDTTIGSFAFALPSPCGYCAQAPD